MLDFAWMMDFPKWFEFKVPKTTVPANYIENA
jgi:hypothetical protein